MPRRQHEVRIDSGTRLLNNRNPELEPIRERCALRLLGCRRRPVALERVIHTPIGGVVRRYGFHVQPVSKDVASRIVIVEKKQTVHFIVRHQHSDIDTEAERLPALVHTRLGAEEGREQLGAFVVLPAFLFVGPIGKKVSECAEQGRVLRSHAPA